MNDTTLVIRNCNNINEANISIKSNKLNIKYGINGTGKSTIVQAINLASSEQGDLSDLLPFKHKGNSEEGNQPSISGLDNIQTIKVFDEEYINQILFKPDEIIKNSFSIFIKTADYEQKMEEIETLISRIKETFNTDDNLNKVIQNLSDLNTSFGNSSSGIHASSKLSKAILKGNPLEDIPEALTHFRLFLNLPDNKNVKWLGWHNKGEDFLEVSDECPYCTSPSSDKTKESIRAIKSEYTPKNIEHLNDIILILERLGRYFSHETNEKLQIIIKNKGNISEEQKTYLVGIKPDIEQLQSKLKNLKDLSFFSFKDTEEAADKIRDLKIDLSFLPHLESPPTEEIVNRVNTALEEVQDKIGLLQGQVMLQKRGIEQTIKNHTEEINEFLKYAGYKYAVDIVEEKNGYKMRLRHIENEEYIENTAMHLSYGERNAFALVLFMYECLSENPDLIILDDPISSFDKNKKYAVTSKLFRGCNSFRGRTVIMLTHDLEPIIDITHTFHQDFHQYSSASYLENNSGIISEISITKEDILSFGEVCKKNIERNQDDIVRSIYLRRYHEILNLHGNEYHILSSLLKKRVFPTTDASGENLMSPEDRDSGIIEIKSSISSFDYDSLVTSLNNEEETYRLYSEVSNNYEKIQIYRVIMQGSSQSDLHGNNIIRKFINEAFHIENEYVMQLDPSKYSPVPQYIIDECTQALDERFFVPNCTGTP